VTTLPATTPFTLGLIDPAGSVEPIVPLPANLPFTFTSGPSVYPGSSGSTSQLRNTSAVWTWLLADAAGNALCELTTAAGKQIVFKRNTLSEATCTISHEDEAASLLWTALMNTGVPTLRCYRRGANDTIAVDRFNGYLAPFAEDAEEQATLSLVFRSPFGRLIGDGSTSGRFLVPELAPFVAVDAGQIAKALIDAANADSFTGLATTGAIIPSKIRNRTYPLGQNIGQAVINLTNVLDGFDFVETPVDGGGTTLAALSIAPSMGVDRPDVRFEYGADTLANVRKVSRTVAPPVNVAMVIGANGLTSVKTDEASIAVYGKWPTLISQTDVTEQATLDDKAWALLRPKPTRVIQFTPDPALAPLPWDDYVLGDTCRFFARRGALAEDVAVKINAFSVVIGTEGEESFAIADPLTPDGAATLQSSLSVEVTS